MINAKLSIFLMILCRHFGGGRKLQISDQIWVTMKHIAKSGDDRARDVGDKALNCKLSQSHAISDVQYCMLPTVK